MVSISTVISAALCGSAVGSAVGVGVGEAVGAAVGTVEASDVSGTCVQPAVQSRSRAQKKAVIRRAKLLFIKHIRQSVI